MITLIRSAIVFAVATLVLSCAGARNQDEKVSSPFSEKTALHNKFVGRWEATIDGLTVSLVLRENLSCVFSIPEGTVEGTWFVSRQNLMVDIPDTDSLLGETFYGLFNRQGDELEFWEEGSEHGILRRVLESQ